MKKILAIALLVAVSACGRPDIPAQRATTSTEPNWSALAHKHEDDELKALGSKQPDLGHFFKVDDTLYRGQQPTDQGMAQLKAKGIRTVVNLRTTDEDVEHERKVAQRLGLNYVSIPVNCFKPVPQTQIDQWLKTVLDPSMQPVFLHCKHGRDRTGSFVAIYRIETYGWGFDKAYDEMKKKGFRTFWVALSYSVRRFAKEKGDNPRIPKEHLEAGLAY